MLNKMKVRTRLMLLLLVILIALAGMLSIALINARFTKAEVDHVYLGGVDDIQELATVKDLIGTDVTDTIHKMRDGTLSWNKGLHILDQANEKIKKFWNNYVAQPSYLGENLAPTRNSLIEQIVQGMKAFNASLLKLQNILEHQNKEQLAAFASNELYPLVDPLSKDIQRLIDLHIQDTKSDYEIALAETLSLFRITLMGIFVAFVISLWLTIAIIKSIVNTLEYAVKNIDHLAEGDTAIKMEITSGGELGVLLKSIQKTTLSIDKIGNALSKISRGDLTVETAARSERDLLGCAMDNMVVQMRKMIGEIQQEVNNLTTSSQEIVASLAQLSTGATETAAAVTETTTTVEELKQTASLSADKAKDVLATSEESMQTVKSSEDSVAATIEDMKQIQDKMQVISDSILKLSEKGLAIAEIMNTVNDLAEQSNLLAVNAAIEAAKAGEQGRSFGVVAQEIRSLAEQSKGATVQVRSLLNDIQNATNAAVLATEQGSKAVSKGVNQSLQTNKSIKEMVENTSKVAQAANQIVLSSQQQLVGVEQVNVAMTNIDEATNQHVGQLEQINGAVGAMNRVGSILKQLTDQYQLSSKGRS